MEDDAIDHGVPFPLHDCPEDVWDAYIAVRRERYLSERKLNLGSDYQTDRIRWDGILEKEWLIMAERLCSGIGVDDSIRDQMGEDFFEEWVLEAEAHQVAADFHEIFWQERLIPFVHYEDFVMLAQQGIFRLEEFALDKGRKWEKKVRELLTSYDYETVGYINILEEVYLHVIKK